MDNLDDLQNKIEELTERLDKRDEENEERDERIETLERENSLLTERVNQHRHRFSDDTQRIYFDIQDAEKITFTGLNQSYEMYREEGNAGELRIDSAVDTEGSIRIGGLNKPLDVYIIGTDEAILRANNNTNTTDLLVEPGKAGFFTDIGNNFFFKLPAGTADPSATTTGALAVVNGDLKIYNGAAWVVVGTQT